MSNVVTQPTVDPVAIWHTEHLYFRRLLDLLDKQVSVFDTGQRPDYEAMLDIITYLREYSDRYHHPREDVAFARLARHHPKLEPLLSRLRQEHRVIANAGEALSALLVSILDGSMVERSELEAAAATYLIYYGSHIDREESDVLTQATRAMTADDWQAVRDAIPASPDPLFGGNPGQHYRALRRLLG